MVMGQPVSRKEMFKKIVFRVEEILGVNGEVFVLLKCYNQLK